MSSKFFHKDNAAARKMFLRLVGGGTFAVIIIIFTGLALFWGALWKPPKPLLGWIVDFDQQIIGRQVSQAMLSLPVATIKWEIVPASAFPSGPEDLVKSLLDERAWVALCINPNASQHLNTAVQNLDPSYNPNQAITVYAVEARQETAFRGLIRPLVQTVLPIVLDRLSMSFSQALVSSGANATAILETAPQLLTTPVSFTIDNLRPFDIPVAMATIFVGLIYLLILCFFLVQIMAQARLMAGLDKRLDFPSLLAVRLVSILISYFIISLFYTAINSVFQVDMTRRFGNAGFVILWMLNYVGMLSLGLAVEAMLPLVTIRFIGFFLIAWIIINVSVVVFPIEVMNNLFRYGYAMPFYNVSRGVRTIIFGTKNELGLNFGILLAWSVLSCCTFTLLLFLAKRREQKKSPNDSTPEMTPRL